MKGCADERAAHRGDLWGSSLSGGPVMGKHTSSPVLVDVVVVNSWDRFFLSQRGVGGAQLCARPVEVVRDFEASPKTEPSSNGSVVGHNQCGAHTQLDQIVCRNLCDV